MGAAPATNSSSHENTKRLTVTTTSDPEKLMADRAGTPIGFCTIGLLVSLTDIPTGANMPIGTTKNAARSSVATATGRHRREGRCPLGSSRKSSAAPPVGYAKL